MARAKKTAKPARRISVDMSEVEARVTLPEGDYRVKVETITQEQGPNADYLKFKFEVQEGKFKGKAIYDNFSLSPAALWRLANVLTALGVDVPKGELDLDFEEVEGLELQVMIEHEDYEGRAQARVSDFYPVDGDASSDDDDEEEAPVKKKAKAKPVEDDDEDEEPVKKGKAKAAPVEDDDDEEEDEKPAKRSRGRPAGSKNKPKDDDEDEDDEEEDEKPAKKGKGTKPKAPTRQELEDMDADELEDVVQKFDLDVDLDDYRTLRKKIAAVIEALT